MPKINGKLKHPLLKTGPKKVKPRGPLWAGPESDSHNGGITQSMIGKWLVCRERARIAYLEGWRVSEGFSHRLEYGQMFHVCEEALAKFGPVAKDSKEFPDPMPAVMTELTEYARRLVQKYPLQQDQVAHWYEVCKRQFPHYVRYWREHPDTVGRRPVFQEEVFKVPYRLPSGRTVYLRGKFDGADVLGTGKAAGLYLVEHKTKGDIDEQAIKRQLTFDMQVMYYAVALGQTDTAAQLGPVRGVRYNVVKRPLSGGKGTIKQKQGEGREEYYDRLEEYIRTEPETYFMRWRAEISGADLDRFRETCMDPLLDAICNWYSVVTNQPVTGKLQDHLINFGHNYRFPYGVTSGLTDGYAADIDDYMDTGSTIGLVRQESLFGELQ